MQPLLRVDAVKALPRSALLSRFTPRGSHWRQLPCTRPTATAHQHVRVLLTTSVWSRNSAVSGSSPLLKSPLALDRNLAKPRLSILPVVASSVQHRSHGGHGHHHHHHDNTFLVSSNKKDAGVRITRIGLFVNLGMAVGKGAGGVFLNSQALLADAVHALTDLLSDFMTLATVAWSTKPPSERFPSGFGKIESLGSLGVSGLLLTGGLWMCFNACNILYAQFFLDAAAAAEHVAHMHHGHSHSHSAADLVPDIKAAWLAAGSIVIKEWLYRATMKIARERKSSVLASNAVHHRVDSLTGVVAFIAIAGTHFFHGATWMDPVGGLIVSLMVIRAGWSNSRAALVELADVAVDEETRDSVRKAAIKSLHSDPTADVAGVPDGELIEVQEVQGLKSGPNYLMEVKLSVPSSWTVKDLQVVETAVRDQVGHDVRGVKRLKVRFASKEANRGDFADEFVGPQTKKQ